MEYDLTRNTKNEIIDYIRDDRYIKILLSIIYIIYSKYIDINNIIRLIQRYNEIDIDSKKIIIMIENFISNDN